MHQDRTCLDHPIVKTTCDSVLALEGICHIYTMKENSNPLNTAVDNLFASYENHNNS